MSEHISIPETAKLIRRALKEAFPGVKFGVTSKSYSGGGTVNVSWWDGPTANEVKKVTWKFEGATFDGQTDYKGGIIHKFEGREVHFRADWVDLHRHITRAFLVNVLNFVRSRNPDFPAVGIHDSYPPGHCTPEGERGAVDQVRSVLNEMSGGAWPGKSALADGIELVRTY